MEDEARISRRGTEKRQRSQAVTVRFTPAELAAAIAAAEASGLSLAGYLRAGLLGNAGPRARRAIGTDEIALAKVLGQLGKIGSNLNQLARAANCGDWPSEPELVQSARELRETCGEIMRALGRRA